MDGTRILDLLQAGLARSVGTLNRLTMAAVTRIGLDAVITSTQLFTPAELDQLRDTTAAVWATGELLGRAIPHLRIQRFRRHAEPKPDVVPDGLRLFAPQQALNYFTGLVPGLNVDHRKWQLDLERDAFTMAQATSMEVLNRVREIIIEGMQEGVPAGAQRIRQVLDAAGLLPSNPQYCFLPGTQIEGMITAASQARYDGPAVKIKTNDGRVLAVTINHPVLTATGWKAAGMIQQGDNLVCYGGPVESLYSLRPLPPQRWAIHNQKMPACVEDVFESFPVESSALNNIQRPAGPLDFHGDAAFFQGKVNRVRAYGMLQDVPDSQTIQFLRQFRFMKRRLISTVSTRMAGSLLHLGSHGLTDATLRTSKGHKNTGLPFRGVRLPDAFREFGTTAQIDPGRFHALHKTTAGDTKLVCNLLGTFPGLISLNSVTEVERISWSGHVYDFQSLHGYVVSQGIISSNCEMVYRTNVMDAHSAGHDREMQDEDMRETFPAWEYAPTIDGHSRPWHAKLAGRMYDQRVPFVLIRGTRAADVCNCRCVPIDLDRWEVQDRLAKGERLYTGVTR